ncbi:MAG: hypothetical protein Q3966_03850 [Neisseria sp.]|nr:hypothetical protein [Neisseria sp.]
MKKALFISLAAALSACGGSPDANNNPGLPPKPQFTIKFLDSAELAAQLPLIAPAEVKEGADGGKTYRYGIKGSGGKAVPGAYIEMVGKFPENLSAVNGQCLDQTAKGWPQGNDCRLLFDKLLAYSVAQPETIGGYLMSHSGLWPLSEHNTYAAVQNGRFILELDRHGKFSLRRRES